MVELALSLPVVFVLLLGIVQVAVVVRDELVVQHAAREGARAASVSATPAVAASTAVARALQHTGLGVVSVRTSATGVDIRVTVSAHTPTDVPLIGAFVGDVEHTATVVMALEPP
ncbi:MAG: pilus assembly protein [Acidimicrobiales bacterium]|nr:pilus assembly protein [Acidimicrobiales bacterium]MCB9393759.1 pilus assembly protein [Acidimicrobiaceae bacterium]